MDDGEEFTVFRHAKVAGQDEPSGVFIVRFTPAHMSVRANIRFSVLPMLPLLGLHGFREKYWCVNRETGMCQGVYAWQTVADAEAYAGSVALRFMTGRSLPGTVSHQVLDQSQERYWAFRDHPSSAAAAHVDPNEQLTSPSARSSHSMLRSSQSMRLRGRYGRAACQGLVV